MGAQEPEGGLSSLHLVLVHRQTVTLVRKDQQLGDGHIRVAIGTKCPCPLHDPHRLLEVHILIEITVDD